MLRIKILTFINMDQSLSKTRASVEHNGMEFLTALMLQFHDFDDFESLCEKIKMFHREFESYKQVIVFNPNPSDPENELNEFRNYVNDIGKKNKFVNSYIQNFRTFLLTSDKFSKDQIQKVFISGKLNRHPEIMELNKNVQKIDAKADIYVLFKDGIYVGISVKQSKNATKSNYSVQKMLGQEANAQLTNIRKQFLTDNGFAKFNKEQRPQINELFYPQNNNNPYWAMLRTLISEKKQELIAQLTQRLVCQAVPYEMYEYDGESFYCLNREMDLSQVTFEEHMPYYFDTKGNPRNAAKLFYRLCVGEKIYRVEIRWKGNIHNSSPQFQLHEDCN